MLQFQKFGRSCILFICAQTVAKLPQTLFNLFFLVLYTQKKFGTKQIEASRPPCQPLYRPMNRCIIDGNAYKEKKFRHFRWEYPWRHYPKRWWRSQLRLPQGLRNKMKSPKIRRWWEKWWGKSGWLLWAASRQAASPEGTKVRKLTSEWKALPRSSHNWSERKRQVWTTDKL